MHFFGPAISTLLFAQTRRGDLDARQETNDMKKKSKGSFFSLVISWCGGPGFRGKLLGSVNLNKMIHTACEDALKGPFLLSFFVKAVSGRKYRRRPSDPPDKEPITWQKFTARLCSMG